MRLLLVTNMFLSRSAREVAELLMRAESGDAAPPETATTEQHQIQPPEHSERPNIRESKGLRWLIGDRGGGVKKREDRLATVHGDRNEFVLSPRKKVNDVKFDKDVTESMQTSSPRSVTSLPTVSASMGASGAAASPSLSSSPSSATSVSPPSSRESTAGSSLTTPSAEQNAESAEMKELMLKASGASPDDWASITITDLLRLFSEDVRHPGMARNCMHVGRRALAISHKFLL